MEIDRNYALVHLDRILHNYTLIKNWVQPANVMAVVKADAYGHGSVPVAKYLEAHGVRYFAVASLSEAIELRDGGLLGEILIFGRTCKENLFYLKKYNLIQTVDSLEYAKTINETKRPIRVHLNIDTGMSRFGFYLHQESQIQDLVDEIKTIHQMEHLKLEGIYTHFANSDEPESDFCQHQFDLFQELLKALESESVKGLMKHAANSAAALAHPEMALDMVRVGIAMYGYPPVKTELPFMPAMSLFARVIAIREVDEKDTVSYGRTYAPDHAEKIATLAIGYADGYNRRLSNKDYVVFNKQRMPVVGRVCMDAIMVAAKDNDLKKGDLVEIFGDEKNLLDICHLLETIPYEPLCHVSKRVVRIYK